jgi:hypothetical protein
MLHTENAAAVPIANFTPVPRARPQPNAGFPIHTYTAGPAQSLSSLYPYDDP